MVSHTGELQRGGPWRTGANRGGLGQTGAGQCQPCAPEPTGLLACALALWDPGVGPFVVMPIVRIQGSHIAYTATQARTPRSRWWSDSTGREENGDESLSHVHSLYTRALDIINVYSTTSDVRRSGARTYFLDNRSYNLPPFSGSLFLCLCQSR